ncbi:MAG TPA: hypothetical protein ENJ27_01975 [Candidatus Moranbacteria bacterium]|nr:hypothetical protein [Candidatus Moranbacteria bacterium]
MEIITIKKEEDIIPFALKRLGGRVLSIRMGSPEIKEISFSVDFPYENFSYEQVEKISKEYGGNGSIAVADDFCRATITLPVSLFPFRD